MSKFTKEECGVLAGDNAYAVRSNGKFIGNVYHNPNSYHGQWRAVRSTMNGPKAYYADTFNGAARWLNKYAK